MLDNIKEILVQYKKRIHEIENKENEFQKIENQIEDLIQQREQKKEELKQLEPHEPDDFFYDETQEEINKIQEYINKMNSGNKKLKAGIEEEKKSIQSEILEKIQYIKTELNNQLIEDKKNKEKLLEEIGEYDEKQQSFKEQREIQEKRKLIEDIDNKRELARSEVKEYNYIIKMVSEQTFDNIEEYINKVAGEREVKQKGSKNRLKEIIDKVKTIKLKIGSRKTEDGNSFEESKLTEGNKTRKSKVAQEFSEKYNGSVDHAKAIANVQIKNEKTISTGEETKSK